MPKILAVKTNLIFPEGAWTGMMPAHNAENIMQTIKEDAEYLERAPLETDPGYKQIIPQVLLFSEGKIFVHRIPETGSEKRLHKLVPIFLGGHIEESDTHDIEMAAWREFLEETGLPQNTNYGDYEKIFLGIVNDETNEVSQVHLGLVWVFVGGKAEVKSQGHDEGVSEGRFVDIEMIDYILPELTHWSQKAWPMVKEFLIQKMFSSVGMSPEQLTRRARESLQDLFKIHDPLVRRQRMIFTQRCSPQLYCFIKKELQDMLSATRRPLRDELD